MEQKGAAKRYRRRRAKLPKVMGKGSQAVHSQRRRAERASGWQVTPGAKLKATESPTEPEKHRAVNFYKG